MLGAGTVMAGLLLILLGLVMSELFSPCVGRILPDILSSAITFVALKLSGCADGNLDKLLLAQLSGRSFTLFD
jgi:hypothetical protein